MAMGLGLAYLVKFQGIGFAFFQVMLLKFIYVNSRMVTGVLRVIAHSCSSLGMTILGEPARFASRDAL